LRVFARAGLGPEDAVRWLEAGIGPYQAEGYCKAGVSLEGALRGKEAGIGGWEAARYLASGVGLDEAAAWRTRGLGSHQALAFRASGLSPSEAPVQHSGSAVERSRPDEPETELGNELTYGGHEVGGSPGHWRPLAANWDEELHAWTLRDWPPGPAGSALLDITEHIQLEADYAQPGSLVEIAIEAGSPIDQPRVPEAERPAVDALIGSGNRARLEALAHPGARARFQYVASPHSSNRLRDALGRLALLVEVAETDADPLRRALALLEAGALASVVDPRLGLRKAAVRWALEGAKELEASVEEGALTEEGRNHLLTEVAPRVGGCWSTRTRLDRRSGERSLLWQERLEGRAQRIPIAFTTCLHHGRHTAGGCR